MYSNCLFNFVFSFLIENIEMYHSDQCKRFSEPPTMFSYIFTLARRRKCLICTFGLTLIIGIWALSIFYIASIRSRSLNNSKGILPVVDFDSHRGHMVARYIKNAENVKGGVDTLAAMGIGGLLISV